MTTFRVAVAPALLRWAVERAGLEPQDLADRQGLHDVDLWLRGGKEPTYKQLERFAQATAVPFGYLFLDDPPHEDVPIPDFRTVGNVEVEHPSPGLLATIYQCELRQDWFREYAQLHGEDPLEFVGSVTVETPVEIVADAIRRQLRFTMDDRVRDATWTDALRRLIDSVEDAGILVMVSGIVGNNTSRPLNPDEFRGFALADPLAPLVFVNGADTKAAQIFTLLHEVAHIWLGRSALSNARLDETSGNAIELWCNRVAAEVLVPLTSLRTAYRGKPTTSELERLAKVFKASTLVVLRRVFDAGFLEWPRYRGLYRDELARIISILDSRPAGGGDFYNTQPLRVSRRFARAIIADTLAGRTLHRDAYRLLGTRKHETFVTLGERVGVA